MPTRRQLGKDGEDGLTACDHYREIRKGAAFELKLAVYLIAFSSQVGTV